MEQTEFLKKNVFKNLKNLNDGFDKVNTHYFSESDFEDVLQQVQFLGIGLYEIKTWHNGEFYGVMEHEDFKKKATDAKWYSKAFLTFKMRQEGLAYSATYKVSKKLLAR
ncbi:MAG: hypothetical protein ACI9O4_001052 [Chitinophagales bacterium]|jgi:hypothetical protein